MGQAWCKEKSNKAQDSKSPLDRVFLRCAHRIYPGLKEEGSVLGGATQRVTSSEIGYASSPPREVLTRGQSIDSVDRPFHPSDWVDVNLEVPVTPRTSTAMTSPVLDTTVYPPPSFASTNFTGSRDFAPIPPPRRKKKNRGRPLPPKPDDVARSHVDRAAKNFTSLQKGHEPLYSSVKLPRNWSNDKEIFEHKINGTGRVIPSIMVAASRSSRDKSSRESERNIEPTDSRRKNSSTISLPNYLELDGVNEKSMDDDDQDEMRIRKITAAGSLPALITSGALEDLKRSGNRKREEEEATGKETVVRGGKKFPMDEVDFSFDLSGKRESQNSISKFEPPRLTSTPVKIAFENDASSPTTVGGWFLHQVRAPGSDLFSAIDTSDARKPLFYDCRGDSRSEILFEAEENRLESNNDNRDRGVEKLENEVERRARTRLKRSLSNESEPFDTREEKDLDRGEIDSPILRSNAEVKLLARTISEESLPREMLENEATDFFEDKGPIATYERSERINDDEGKAARVGSTIEGDTKTPPPSPEPRITPEILDNDHSSRLKVVLRDEDSNLSSMTPSLTELEAALSDMLEREDEPALREDTSDKAQMESSTSEKMFSVLPVTLTNILVSKENSSSAERSLAKHLDDALPMMNVDLTNGGKNAYPPGTPPEKPSRLSQTNHEEASVNSTNVPTPPRRRNRYSGYIPSIIDGRSLERTATPENPYPNDRLI